MTETRNVRSAEALGEVFETFLNLPVHQMMGLSLISASEGFAHARFNASDAALVPGGYVHGGVLSLLMEPVVMFALVTKLPESQFAVTASSAYRFLRAVPEGSGPEITAECVRVGKSIAHCDVKVTVDGRLHADGRLVKSLTSV